MIGSWHCHRCLTVCHHQSSKQNPKPANCYNCGANPDYCASWWSLRTTSDYQKLQAPFNSQAWPLCRRTGTNTASTSRFPCSLTPTWLSTFLPLSLDSLTQLLASWDFAGMRVAAFTCQQVALRSIRPRGPLPYGGQPFLWFGVLHRQASKGAHALDLLWSSCIWQL